MQKRGLEIIDASCLRISTRFGDLERGQNSTSLAKQVWALIGGHLKLSTLFEVSRLCCGLLLLKMSCSVSRCEEFLKSLESIPRIKTLLDSISGGRPKIECRACSDFGPEGAARAALFNDSPPTLVLCTNRLEEKDLPEAVTHELIHAFDFSNQRCNFYTCDGLAYTEVRAAREAECSRYFPFQFMKDHCVKHHATQSTSNLFGKDAGACVERVFLEAYADMHPTVNVSPGLDVALVSAPVAVSMSKSSTSTPAPAPAPATNKHGTGNRTY